MGLAECFTFTWQVDPSAPTVIPPDTREGVHLSDAVGQAAGVLTGGMRFSMYTAGCPLDPGYLELPEGEPKASGDHVCTVNPGALPETDDGATIQLDFKGFGVRLDARAPLVGGWRAAHARRRPALRLGQHRPVCVRGHVQ